MKKLVLLAIVLISAVGFAQKPAPKQKNHKAKKEHFKNLSAEQIATLKSKKMTLHLDLSENQYTSVYNLMLQEAKEKKSKMKEREGKEKPSEKEHFERMNKRLDKQIAFKRKMKTILNKEQYEKWEKSHGKLNAKRRKHRQMKK